jgi:DNA-directed RNA polymerase specialized sigma subunit
LGHTVTQEDLDWALGVARKFARKVPHMVEEFESAAGLGLAEAANSFEPERGLRFHTHAMHRVVGAIRDAARDAGLKGYRRSWVARHPGEEPPAVASIHATLGVSAAGRPWTLADAIGSGDGPVGWEAEHQDEVEGVSRRLPRCAQAAFRAHFGRADGATQKGAGRLAGVSESRVSQILDEASGLLKERFTRPGEVFMAGKSRIPEEAFEAVNGHAATAVKVCPTCDGECNSVNGRCYRCKPNKGGWNKGKVMKPAAARPPETTLVTGYAPEGDGPAAPEPAPIRASAPAPDALSLAFDAIEALERLDPAARRRVIEYVSRRGA